MAKMKRRPPKTARNKKAARSKVVGRKAGARKTPVRAAARKVAKRAKRVPSRTVKAAAKRVLVSAGRTARALARAGAERAGRAGRTVLARGVRSAAVGVQKTAQGAGDLTASALESIADRVEPEGASIEGGSIRR